MFEERIKDLEQVNEGYETDVIPPYAQVGLTLFSDELVSLISVTVLCA